MLFAFVFVWAEVPFSSFMNGVKGVFNVDSTALKDNTFDSDSASEDSISEYSISIDSVYGDRLSVDTLTADSLSKKSVTGPDTTKMDSMQLAIYRYNKAIDDSLAFDSMNRKRKNGIDAPVKYSAEDSLVFEAATGVAHLYGDSHVE